MNNSNRHQKGVTSGGVVKPKEEQARLAEQKLPISQIIERFHRVKEEKNFTPKDKQIIQQRRLDKIIGKKNVQASAETRDSMRCDTQVPPADPPGEQTGMRRRLSLPSLFHPFSPVTASRSVEDLAREAREASDEALGRAGEPRSRRHSVSHVIQEYGKRSDEQLERLTAAMMAKLDSIERQVSVESGAEGDDEEFNYWYLSGDDLHAFFNMWENSSNETRETVRAKLNKLNKLSPARTTVAAKPDHKDSRPVPAAPSRMARGFPS